MLNVLFLAVSFALPRAEFAKYHAEITGRAPAADAVTFAVDARVSTGGNDAYTLVSEGAGVKITGSNERSVWYGLYDLLERRGGCHWFWDGDVVPKKPTIDLSGLDVREEARFEYRGLRYFAHRGLTRFQAEHWGPEEWKREIDWLLKRRLNVFMLRIGQDDLFQRTFPETCAYPDASKPLPGAGKGFDNRSLFWPLEYRGKLRQDVQRYAFARGLLVPEDFGTMTHWYSRTPEDYLDAKRPEFLPQATRGYAERNGLVWDIRDEKWADEYWKLTKTAVDAYGTGAPERLLHTIGLGERKCFTNRQENFELKLTALDKFLTRARRDYPDAKVLLAGWDFYFTWQPEEVRALVKRLDPKHAIIWDYEGDVTNYRAGTGRRNDFTNWDVIGKFPYTYSIFLSYESALDARANYPLIEERQKVVQNDPACAGYILWPESSHTDTLCLDFFTANAWASNAVPHAAVLETFCANRYGTRAESMRRIWEKALPLSWMLRWRGGCSYVFSDGKSYPSEDADEVARIAAWKGFERAPEIFSGLAAIGWPDAFLCRDTVDLARMVLDRTIVRRFVLLKRDYADWQAGRRDGADLPSRARNIYALTEKLCDVLALHSDFSLWESYERMNAVEPVRNPDFPQVLLENAANGYCRGHQYEVARHLYLPRAESMVSNVVRAVAAGDHKAELLPGDVEAESRVLMKRPLSGLRPTLPRTEARFRETMKAVEALLRVSDGPAAPVAVRFAPNVQPAPTEMTVGSNTLVRLDRDLVVTVACLEEPSAAVAWADAHLEDWFKSTRSGRFLAKSNRPEVRGAEFTGERLAGGDEAYELVAAPEGVAVRANALQGVRYALYTLRQTTHAMPRTSRKTEYFAMPAMTVRDAPALAFRGVHIPWSVDDSAVEIEKRIRLAAYLKYNYAVIEPWGTYRSEKHPWWGWKEGTMTAAAVRHLVKVAKDHGLTLCPQIPAFGHASMGITSPGKHAVLDAHPEFAPLFEGLNGWNWCLSNPETLRVQFELIDELIELFDHPPYFHVGCDEAAKPNCPECLASDYRKLVVAHILALHKGLKARGAKMMLWHDMFLKEGDVRWEGFYANGTDETVNAFEKFPRDLVVCDWFYGKARPDGRYPTLSHFKKMGFEVVTCPWYETDGTALQGQRARELGLLGLLMTTWGEGQGKLRGRYVANEFAAGACAAWGTPYAKSELWKWNYDLDFIRKLRDVEWDMGLEDYADTGAYQDQVPAK